MSKSLTTFLAITSFFLATAIAAVVHVRQLSSAPIVSLCELSRNPRLYLGKTVRVRAYFISDGLEHTMLVENRCRIGLRVSQIGLRKADEYWSVDKKHEAPAPLTDMIAWGIPFSSKGKQILGTFKGQFAWSEDDERGAITIESVTDVRSKSCPQRGPSNESQFGCEFGTD